MSERRETPIMVEIRAAVCALPGVRVWRNNTGKGRRLEDWGSPRPAFVLHFGLGEGSADLVGICKHPIAVDGGRFFALEVKTSRRGSKTTPEQLAWARCIRELGGFCAVVRSVDEALQAVERCRRGESS
jgi:hypothetical protein